MLRCQQVFTHIITTIINVTLVGCCRRPLTCQLSEKRLHEYLL